MGPQVLLVILQPPSVTGLPKLVTSRSPPAGFTLQLPSALCHFYPLLDRHQFALASPALVPLLLLLLLLWFTAPPFPKPHPFPQYPAFRYERLWQAPSLKPRPQRSSSQAPVPARVCRSSTSPKGGIPSRKSTHSFRPGPHPTTAWVLFSWARCMYPPPPLYKLRQSPNGPYAYCSLDTGVACARHIPLPTPGT